MVYPNDDDPIAAHVADLPLGDSPRGAITRARLREFLGQLRGDLQGDALALFALVAELAAHPDSTARSRPRELGPVDYGSQAYGEDSEWFDEDGEPDDELDLMALAEIDLIDLDGDDADDDEGGSVVLAEARRRCARRGIAFEDLSHDARIRLLAIAAQRVGYGH